MIKRYHVPAANPPSALARRRALRTPASSASSAFIFHHSSTHLIAASHLEPNINTSIHSEQKIDRIEASLGSIERLLQRRQSQRASTQESTGTGSDSVASPNASVTISDSSAINTPAHIDSSEPEPDQGLNVQTDMTVALLKQAVRSTTLYGVDAKMGAALGSLYDLLGKRHLSSPGASAASPFPMQKPVPPGGVGKLEMPPLQVALAALERLTRRFHSRRLRTKEALD